MILAARQLAVYINGELKNLEHVVTLAKERITASKKYPGEIDAFVESAALHLQSFYTASEQVMARIAENVDGTIPDGSTWHADLLKQMTYEIPGARPPVITQETHDLLDELRGFRHRVRNVYTFRLNPERVETLVDHLSVTHTALSQDLKDFIQFLEELTDE